MARWNDGCLTYDSEVLGIACAGKDADEHARFFERLSQTRSVYSGWLALTSGKAGLQKATALNKSDIDEFPFPADEADLDLTENDQIILRDAFDYYRDFQRLGKGRRQGMGPGE